MAYFYVLPFIDPDFFSPVTIDQLKQAKTYQKVTQKFDRELEALRRKHEKVSCFVFDDF